MTVWGTAPTVAVCPGEFLERVVFLESDPYERLKNMATQARANRSQFLEHLILRAEAIWNFQPLLPASRPWWNCGVRSRLRSCRSSCVPRQLYLPVPVGVNQICWFTSSAWPRCWAALVR